MLARAQGEFHNMCGGSVRSVLRKREKVVTFYTYKKAKAIPVTGHEGP
jgi:hypothetical protein